ncbi:MAG: alanine--tRNA ligase [Desulfobacterales bacterium]|nr:alanine--tRNA ligase [Desulfobacterales bacterium]MDJ0853973.1 alanine--tRNA ligase [Desulfobacterales bacterium]MDJ0888899.1 alanine--tRNA ligase [Desulfobacterales bacterium]
MTGNEARKLFLDFFEKHDHQVVRSSSLVPADDPTLLFTNAGMVQFKRAFLGEEKRNYVRATTSQKCVRAGGKHNDLENVGYTARHHTFFEMLGNFSFGDYFKEKAIEYGWDLLVNGYGLPADRLWVSIYLDDDEAADIWHQQIGVPTERIVRLGEEENFWAMGDTGPCGPCSEIHLDRGGACGLGNPDCGVDCDCDRFLEIWNLVFMQFNRDASGKMEPLPKPSIDTGLGLERTCSVLQDVETNYDIDLMVPIINRTEELAGRSVSESRETEVAMKVIADHSRATAFLIGDGVLPSNEGRGYVLRRIMRRAIRYGRNIGLVKPFLHDTARTVMDIMRPAYPELGEAEAFITNVIENEEVRFSETLDNGLRVLNDALGELRARGENVVPGDVIFKLYDTFGFPVDIVRDVVRDEKLELDMAGFDAAMDRQRAQSRAKVTFTEIGDAYRPLSAEGFQPEFKGYEALALESRVVLLVKDGAEAAEAAAGDAVEIVAEVTPFYGEAGGQVGDVGTINGLAGDPPAAIDIGGTIKDPTGLIIHKGVVNTGRIATGDAVRLQVDLTARQATARNHTATHILHAVLREVLGDHVKQAGSLVAPDRLRFDFTHFSQIEPAVLAAIERKVNARILENVATHTDEMAAEEAFQSGATALFEEKYGDRVRVVSLADFSKELCGGTHVGHTGDIGFFKIVGESSVAAGVRRVEAMTGEGALDTVQQMARSLDETARLLKDSPQNITLRIEKLLAQQKELEKEVERLKGKLASQTASDAETDVREVNGVKVLARRVEADNPGALRDLVDRFRDRLQSGVVVLGCVSGAKALLIAGVTPDLQGRFHAGNVIRQLAPVVGGGGGGKPDLAQAGGSQPEHLDQALARAYEVIAGM